MTKEEQANQHHNYKERIFPNYYNNINWKEFLDKLDENHIIYHLFDKPGHIRDLIDLQVEIRKEYFLSKLIDTNERRYSGAEMDTTSYYGIHFTTNNLTIGFKIDYNNDIYPIIFNILKELNNEKICR